MVDDVLINKAASIERCVARVREEYEKDPATFEFDFTRQDAALDMGQHVIRREGLGVPQSARDVFELPHRGGWLAPSLLPVMKNMVGFTNIAVQEYQTLQLPITAAIITQHLGDFLLFSSAILRRDVASPNS